MNIGIVSVPRPERKSYLNQTLQSVLAVPSFEYKNLRVVLLLPDPDKVVLDSLTTLYKRHLDLGLLVVVGPVPDGYYQALQGLPRFYDDSPQRIEWRSKQNLDYAFLWRMSLQMKAQYFLQLEDDVFCVDNYFKEIRLALTNEQETKTDWALIEFSKLGFIGKLFKMEDLNKMASLAYHFYAQQPVDYLLVIFRMLMNQKEAIHYSSIFKHIGRVSSLSGKTQFIEELQDLKDATADNPPASVQSSMKSDAFRIENAYNRKQTDFFWYDKPKPGDDFVVKFDTTQDIRTLSIRTGSPLYPNDILEHGRVYWSTGVMKNASECGEYNYDGVFTGGKYTLEHKYGVKCVMVQISGEQEYWLLVNDIAVHVNKDD